MLNKSENYEKKRIVKQLGRHSGKQISQNKKKQISTQKKIENCQKRKGL